MEIQYYGANCIRITVKKAVIIIDDNLAELGKKSVTKAGDIALFTHEHKAPAGSPKIIIDQPGEYEVSDVSVAGVPARAHMDEAGKHSATIFKISAGDIRAVVLGHIYPELDDDQLEALGMVDVLFVPVGNTGYTLDSIGALKVIKKIEPKVVIPTHYAEDSISYPVPQQTLEDALKGLSMEPKETVGKLKLKAGELADTTQLVILEQQ